MIKFSAYGTPKKDQPQRVYSVDHPLQVFAPLRLMPRRLLLLPTACHQVKVSGGPSLGDIVWRFHVGNASVATAEEAGGLVCGLRVGVTRLVATVHSLRGGKMETLLTRDEISVEVAKMTGLALELPAAHLVAGEEVVVYAQPLYRNEHIYGARDLTFSWDSSNEDALAITCVHNRDLPARQVGGGREGGREWGTGVIVERWLLPLFCGPKSITVAASSNDQWTCFLFRSICNL